MGWWDRNKHLYPEDWEAIARRIKELAGWRCAACNIPHGTPGHVLTVHHLDHDVTHSDDSNLVALCQVCHLRLGPYIYTKEEAIARLRRRYEIGLGQLCFSLSVTEAVRPIALVSLELSAARAHRTPEAAGPIVDMRQLGLPL
jgi:5-methylcytosine-specific restriction endonuclease McrA